MPPALVLRPSAYDERVSRISIGERIRSYRKAKGLTQREVAKDIGVNQPVVSYWENNQRMPHPRYMLKLAELFGIEPSQLYTGKSLDTALQEASTAGERIIILRHVNGLTQQEVAEEIGVGQSTISKLENTLSTLGPPYIPKLAKLFQVEQSVLYTVIPSQQYEQPAPAIQGMPSHHPDRDVLIAI